MQLTVKKTAKLAVPQSQSPAITPTTFIEMLAQKSHDRNVPKKDRTRYHLFHIVASAIQADSSHSPTVEDLLSQSTLSRGTFYNHFKDIDNCVFEMLSLFMDFNAAPVLDRKERTPFESILDTNIWYCSNYEANANLYAVISNNAELGRIRAEQNGLWAKTVVKISERRRGKAYKAAEKRELEGIVRILITMTIEALRDRFVHSDALMSVSFPTAKALAVALSRIWYQSIYVYESSSESH